MAGLLDISVGLPYPVFVGRELELAAAVSQTLEPGTGVILTDSNVGPLHAHPVRRALEGAGWRVGEVIEVPAGESSKDFAVYSRVIRRLARSGLGRDAALFALGGGVIGDLGGFVAATYLRGISLVGLPTSLLAMVDSSVGGKVGLDLPEGKNLVGAFVRPRLVAADLGWLETLPERQICCGLAEVIKMGLLAGGAFFTDLDLIEKARSGDAEALQTLVGHSVRFKARIVSEDEFEGGRRAILNYGHTVGHGLEAASGYALPHGEAVGLGMLCAARLAEQRFGSGLVGLHEDLLRRANLPARASSASITPRVVIAAMARDKKRRTRDAPGRHRFVLLEDLGRPVWGVAVEEAEVREAVEGVVGRGGPE